jgi:hypothetical protein
MKVFHKETGAVSHHEAVDAKEMVETGEYTFDDPNAAKGDPPAKTAGEVLRASEEERRKENMRSQYEQHAASTEVQDHRKMAETNPAMKARAAAVAARTAADSAAALAANGGNPGVNVTATPASLAKLKADAAAKEKAAEKAEADADKAEKDAAAANEALKARQEKEAKAASGKGAGKGTAAPPADEDLETLTKSELQERLDAAGVDYTQGENKDELIKKLKKADKKG